MSEEEKVGAVPRVMLASIDHSIATAPRRCVDYETPKDCLDDEIIFPRKHRQVTAALPASVLETGKAAEQQDRYQEDEDGGGVDTETLVAMLEAAGGRPELKEQILAMAQEQLGELRG